MLTANHLAKSLGSRLYAQLYSCLLPDICFTDDKGGVDPPMVSFHHVGSKGIPELLLIQGNSQPNSTYGRYELAGEILSAVEDSKCKLLVSLDGFPSEGASRDDRRVLCAATSRQVVSEVLPHTSGRCPVEVTGMAALLAGLAGLRGLDAVLLLVEARPPLPDLKSVRTLLQVLQRWLGIAVDLSELDRTYDESKRLKSSFEPTGKERVSERVGGPV